MTTVTNTDTPSQLEEQLELLCSFNVQIPCNPQGEFAESGFKTLLQSLNTNLISDSLCGSYHDVHLKKWKEYAQREFDEMGRINRLRLESLIQLSDQEMQQAMFEEARKYPGQEKEFFDFVQKNDEVQQQIRAPLFEDKVVDFIIELATISEKKVSKDNLQKAIAKDD